MYTDSSETLVFIAFTKIIKFQKNKNIFCANECEWMQLKVYAFALVCISYRLNDVFFNRTSDFLSNPKSIL